MELIFAEPALVIALAVLCALGWGASMLAMPFAHHGHGTGALFIMWAAMMVGMMIPPEAPALLRLARARHSLRAPAAFLTGFLLPWVLYSLGAALLQVELSQRGLMDHSMAVTSRPLAGALFLGAGLLQLSPLKRACLEKCRAPSSSQRPFLDGLQASALSIGSCGVLMLVLFATGVMSVPAMVVLTLLLLVEHWLPRGSPATSIAGALLCIAGIWKLIPWETL